jgi:hypothetical protein
VMNYENHTSSTTTTAVLHERSVFGRYRPRLRAAGGIVGSAGTNFTWVGDEFLVRHGVGPWMEVPLWAPEAEAPGLGQVDGRRAYQAGLHFRSLAETIREKLAWRATQPADAMGPAGLAPTYEREVLAAWHAEQA